MIAHEYLCFLACSCSLPISTAGTEFRRTFLLGYPWRWNFSWSESSHTKEIAGPWWGVLKGTWPTLCNILECSHMKSLFFASSSIFLLVLQWKFAFLSLGRPEYLQDSDIVSSRFQVLLWCIVVSLSSFLYRTAEGSNLWLLVLVSLI